MRKKSPIDRLLRPHEDLLMLYLRNALDVSPQLVKQMRQVAGFLGAHDLG